MTQAINSSKTDTKTHTDFTRSASSLPPSLLPFLLSFYFFLFFLSFSIFLIFLSSLSLYPIFKIHICVLVLEGTNLHQFPCQVYNLLIKLLKFSWLSDFVLLFYHRHLYSLLLCSGTPHTAINLFARQNQKE